MGSPCSRSLLSKRSLHSGRLVTYMTAPIANPTDFEAWYRAVHPRLVTLLAASTGDAELAREAADEALARAFQRWEHVSEMVSPTGWTYKVSLNVARRSARRRTLERRLLRRIRQHEDVPGPTGELWLIVADLAPRQRTAVLLRHVGQLTEQEIADVMGVARGTVSSTLRSAYRRLGAALTAEDCSLEEASRD